MAKTAHTWAFRTRFRSGAYGWKSSRLACERLKQAVLEIVTAARVDAARGAEGAILLMERIWPAFQGVDTSSGALGSMVYWALDHLIPIVRDAPASRLDRQQWLYRMWEAAMEDGVDYLSPVLDRWGELCGSREEASRWADALSGMLAKSWADPAQGYFRGTHACLSCLLACGKHEDLFRLLAGAPYPSWSARRYGVEALLAEGRPDDAIEYAEGSRGLNQPGWAIDRKCEEILLAQGRHEEAYTKYALTANEANTGVATFRAIKKKYPRIDPRRILMDLANSAPDPGRFFAAAKDEGLFDLAIDFAQRGRTDPRTLSRAARDLVEQDARFSAAVGLLAVNRFLDGSGYEVLPSDVTQAWDHAAAAAVKLGALEQVRTAVLQRTSRSRPGRLGDILQRHILRTDGSVIPN